MKNKKALYIFLILLPFIDLITSLTTRFFPFPISLGVIIKTMFLIATLIYLIFRSTSKNKKLSICYMSLIFIYIIIYMSTKIKYLTFTDFINESMYLIKICYFPLLLISLICYFDDKKLDKDELKKVLFINIVTYIFLLLIPLITSTGFNTYRKGTPGTIGWFYSGNEISFITTLLLPFMFTKLNKNNLYYVLIIISIIILSTIGTKVSMLGIIVDVLLLQIILFKNKDKKLRIKAGVILIISLAILSQSSTLSNYITSTKLQEGIKIKQNKKEDEKESKEEKQTITVPITVSQEERLLNEEYQRIKKEEQNENKEASKFEKFIYKYVKSLLSDRDIYLKVTYKIYKKNYNTNTLLFGIGYSNTNKIQNFGVTKLIEIDPLDIYFHSGLIALPIILFPFVYYLIELIKSRKLNSKTIFYSLMIGMMFGVSCISGHTLTAPAVSIYIVLYFILAFNEIGLIDTKKNNIEKNKVTIYSLHDNYGGVEKSISLLANILSDKYKVEIINIYKLLDKPYYNINDKVSIKYLTNNIKPNKKEFKESLKHKNIISIIKESLYSIKVLYLKNTLLTKSMIECNSEIIISTRIDFSLKLIHNNEYNNIKVSEEHSYHNNNIKYLNNLNKILKRIDYLMPSSNYLTEYYKELFPEFSHKIITNKIPIETNNKISKLSNKQIISVGRLSKEKGFDNLIDIFKTINKKYTNWKLIIVGEGEERDNLQNKIDNYKLNNCIELVGKKTTEELNDLYASSDMYVMTSLEESFGLVLLEASSHGLPIMAFDSALGAKEIISNDKGILISNRNKRKIIESISSLIDNKKLMKNYQTKSLENYKLYDYDLIKGDKLKFYTNIKKNTMKEKKVLFIASTGGHLDELMQLKPMFDEYKSYIITEKDKSTISLKDNYKNMNYLMYGTRKKIVTYPFIFLYNIIKSLYLFIKIRPAYIITTGTHTAVPICYIGKLFGSKIIFIETFANKNTKTLSGRMIYPIADLFIVQWKEMLQLYPKAMYGGSIY